MPRAKKDLTAAEARRLAGEQVDATPSTAGSGRVGLEIEWLPRRADDTTCAASHAVVRETVDAAGPGPGGCALTFEPGGQLELSSPPFESVAAATAAVTVDAAHLGAALAEAGVVLVGMGLDPISIGPRVLDTPRYAAMEAYFDQCSPAGRTMMRSTAAIQINLDLVTSNGASVADRWRLAHDLGPVLAAAFANSPCQDGRPTGWRSRRLATWLAIDGCRTSPVGGSDPRTAWADYALAAQVMLIRGDGDACDPVLEPLSFGQWLDQGHELGHPTADDLAYHVTTLFPPVRPRGWLELRMLDSLPDRWWPVAAAVTTALLDDGEAATRAAVATAGTGDLWLEAARCGPRDPAAGPGGARMLRRRAGCDGASRRRPGHAGGDGRIRRALRRAGPLPGRRPPRRARARRAGPGVTAMSKSDIAAALGASRQRTLAVLEPVGHEDEARQHSPLMSPLVWDLAHIAHFEELWLVRELAGEPPTNTRFDDVYDAFKHPRRDRPSLDLLDPGEARAFAADVRRRTLAVLDDIDLDVDDPLRRDGFVYGMVVQHEHQHIETMLATIQLRDVPYDAPGGPVPTRTAAGAEVDIASGPFVLGTDDEPWAYDNERPAHPVELAPFRIDAAPVTNGEYLAFVAAGGYDEPSLWTEDGWVWRKEADLVAPQFWRPDGAGGWTCHRFGVEAPLQLDEPVQHVCWYEADAFARFAGKRLPTETEWERAAPELKNTGIVWEWTASDFAAYPGFRPFPYREYSEVFFGDEYKVLRGGSWATHPDANRLTFRNWDFPIRRQIFAGFRCAS